jgi:hypothetical protein
MTVRVSFLRYSNKIQMASLVSLAFAPFAPTQAKSKSITTLPIPKLLYLACNLLTLGVGLWKCRSMGLLPTGTGDWLAFETRGLVRYVNFVNSTYIDVLYLCFRHLRYCYYDAFIYYPSSGFESYRISQLSFGNKPSAG